MKITLFLEVVSSWCHWVEPTWARLRSEFGDRLKFDWKVALMDPSGLPVSQTQCDWFYRRSGTLVRSAYMLNSGWFQSGLAEYLAPNLVPEAARDLGIHDDRARLAIAEGALLLGLKVADWQVSVDLAAKACDLDTEELMRLARSPEIEARCRRTTAEFHELGLRQRPAFVLENTIGDRATFSGVVAYPPLSTAIEAMLADAAGYTSYAAHHGGPPAA
jgi:predicted DsbA family dithiol-disulfide isomerase